MQVTGWICAMLLLATHHAHCLISLHDVLAVLVCLTVNSYSFDPQPSCRFDDSTCNFPPIGYEKLIYAPALRAEDAGDWTSMY